MKRIATLAVFALLAGMGVAMAAPSCGGSSGCGVIDEPTAPSLPQGCGFSGGCVLPEATQRLAGCGSAQC